MTEKTVTLDRKVPAFSAAASGGRKWQLADAAGKNLVVYSLSEGQHVGL